MLELMNVIKKQSDELQKLMDEPYGTKVFTRLETTEAGDNDREFPCTTSDNGGSISVRDARSNGIKPLVANFVNGVHEDEQCIIH